MNHASLFSGIGGFDLAASIMGWQNIFHCENNEFCRKILKYHFKNSIGYGDIKTTDFRVHEGQVDILTGGFPCQPFSDAGLKGGTNDPRYLWPEMFRAIREIRPKWVVAENVRGLISWNSGLVFDTVCDDMENEGYEVWPFLLPACGVNAPHQRYRIWFIAYAHSNGADDTRFDKDRQKKGESEIIGEKWKRFWNASLGNGTEGIITDGKSIGRRKRRPSSSFENDYGAIRTNFLSRSDRFSEEWDATDPTGYRPQERDKIGTSAIGREIIGFDGFPTQPPVCRRNDGFPSQLDGITFPQWRQQSIKGYGNAIVPQVVLQIFKAIEAFEYTIKGT